MRKHPLLAFATALSTVTITLSATVGTAQAAAKHPTAISTSRAGTRHHVRAHRHHVRAHRHHVHAHRHRRHFAIAATRLPHARVLAHLTEASLLRPGSTVKFFTPLEGVWAQLRVCESGGNYMENTGNGFYGAYQFSLSTWEGIGFTGLPSQAAPGLQDKAALRLQQRAGWHSWPMCSWHLNLS